MLSSVLVVLWQAKARDFERSFGQFFFSDPYLFSYSIVPCANSTSTWSLKLSKLESIAESKK
jgi:hypothetical protein